MPFFIDNFGQRNRKLVLTPDMMHEYGRQGLSRQQIADRHNVHVQTVNKQLEKVTLKKAYEAGKKLVNS